MTSLPSWSHSVSKGISEVGWDHERFAIHVWRSVRATGDTKIRKSRRTLGLPKQRVRVLHDHQDRQAVERARTAAGWQAPELVFTSATGGQLDKVAVLRAFRKVVTAVGLDPRSGRRTSNITRSSRCSQTRTCLSRRSPVWSATRTRRPPRPSTGTRYGPSLGMVRKRWTAYSLDIDDSVR